MAGKHSRSDKGELILASDGQLAIPAGPWAKEKLYYIGRYCEIFNQAMKGKWQTRVYIDLFAGPGRCVVRDTGEEIDGSPIVALKSGVPFTHYIFNDSSRAFVDALRARVSSLAPSLNVVFLNQDCNQVATTLLATLGTAPALAFCFIDPFNWEIEFTTIERLTQGRNIDLAITFHTGHIKRFALQARQKLDAFFPDSGWLEGYNSKRAEGDRALSGYLLSLYKKGLCRITYSDIQERVLLTNQKGVPLYHLLFASKHRRGKEFWDKISQRKPSGQIRLL